MPASTPVSNVSSSAPTVQEAESAASQADPSTLSMSTSVSSLADLKKKAPQVYNMMMEGIALNICNDMQHHQDRLKQMMRQGESQS